MLRVKVSKEGIASIFSSPIATRNGRIFGHVPRLGICAQTAGSSSTDKDGITASSTGTLPAKLVEENRMLPQKYNSPDKDAIISRSRQDVLDQIAAGGKPRIPFRLWRMIFSNCNDYTLVGYVNLSPEERIVHGEHWRAMQERRLTYKDPYTGYEVMTAAALLLQGRCCGSCCRHCPYDHENVPMEVARLKKWNGAYYV